MKQRELRKFQDNIHGYIVECYDKNMAWRLIKSICVEQGYEIPQLKNIKEI